MPLLTIDTGDAARVTVRSDDGAWHHPVGAVRDRTAAARPGVLDMDRDPSDASAVAPGYTEHFVSGGSVELEVPRGSVTLEVTRGPEHTGVTRRVEVGATGARVSARPQRFADLAAEGWWSGDLHVHRPVADAAAVLRSEDLHLGAFVTQWNEVARRPQEPHAPGAPSAALTVDGDRHAVAPVTEDERGGGAWILHGTGTPDLPDTTQWWYPTGRSVVDRARAAGAHFDLEKLTWWEVPVMMATGAPDSVGVLNNHYVPGGFFANEAWGRPRPREAYPGKEGTSRYQLGLYYRYLNLGFRLPASAGSASGVLPAPAGHNRVYVQGAADPAHAGPCTVGGFYAALRAGRSMVTNGPLLSLTVGDAGPGGTVAPGRTSVRAAARAAGRVGGIEVLADGVVVARTDGGLLEADVDLTGARWVAARATAPDPATIRLAHTSPVYVDRGTPSPAVAEQAVADRAYFARWVAELIEATTTRRLADRAQRAEVLELYERAAAFYAA